MEIDELSASGKEAIEILVQVFTCQHQYLDSGHYLNNTFKKTKEAQFGQMISSY